ncbi:MAG: aspartate--ammonia ligase [Bacteroidales bacterium]|nr:aspartate--ammonia ligase [Bacteroidales bacterium]
MPETIQDKVSTITDVLKTEEAICYIKDNFSKRLALSLNLVNVSAPIAVLDGTGINDDLNGIEKPVSFSIKSIGGQKALIVQSLAKWKRMRLKEFHIEPGKGILTDMRAIRPDEDLDPIHSIYVDQWDWEKCILPGQRTLQYLKSTVENIYEALKATETDVCRMYPWLTPELPDKIHFIHADELLKQFPDLTVKQRETKIAQSYGAVFIIGIGANLSNGQPHDGRAPDYDDWSTINEDGYYGLNGDIILWNPILQSAFEISSMGIRVNKEALEKQLEIKGCTYKKNLLFHRMLLEDQLPMSIGGGIGQSRVCMFFLKKIHIGEVQSSIWPVTTFKQSENKQIKLL